MRKKSTICTMISNLLHGVNPHNGEIYVADAVDYSQAGVIRRYSPDGTLLDQFRVGINPNGFAFK